MTKRDRRKRQPKPGELRAYYGIDSDGEGPDVCFGNGDGVSRAHAHLLCSAFCSLDVGHGRSLVQELKARGFAIESLRFSVTLREADRG